MSGLLGGLLALVHYCGGIVLHLLIGKSAAWKDTKDARRFRLVFGSIAIGLIIATPMILFIPPPPNQAPGSKETVLCFVPILLLIVVYVLEKIRDEIDGS